MLSQKALDEFKRIWREERGTEIPHELAVAEAMNLLTLFNTIYRPLRKEWVDENKYEKDRRDTQ